VTRENADGHFHLYKCNADNGGGCVQAVETNWDPHNVWPGGSVSTFMGETNHEESDVPGRTDSRTNFSQVREKQPDTDDWITGDLDFIGFFEHNTEHYRFEFVDQDSHFRIWTYPIDR
jgi:hypothetical protein